MKYLVYLSEVINEVAIDFEIWTAYETSLIEALLGLVIFQFLEDIILSAFKNRK